MKFTVYRLRTLDGDKWNYCIQQEGYPAVPFGSFEKVVEQLKKEVREKYRVRNGRLSLSFLPDENIVLERREKPLIQEPLSVEEQAYVWKVLSEIDYSA